MQRFRFAMFGIFLAAALLVTQSASAKDKLVMGVHPYKPAAELHKIFKPVADYISQKARRTPDRQVL